MAPPKKPIDEKLLGTLAKVQCTMEEMAAACDCSKDTLERRYAAFIKKAQESGKSSLRRVQWKNALGGNVAMQIWLGKQLLGQREPKSQLELSGDEENPVQFIMLPTPEGRNGNGNGDKRAKTDRPKK